MIELRQVSTGTHLVEDVVVSLVVCLNNKGIIVMDRIYTIKNVLTTSFILYTT